MTKQGKSSTAEKVETLETVMTCLESAEFYIYDSINGVGERGNTEAVMVYCEKLLAVYKAKSRVEDELLYYQELKRWENNYE